MRITIPKISDLIARSRFRPAFREVRDILETDQPGVPAVASTSAAKKYLVATVTGTLDDKPSGYEFLNANFWPRLDQMRRDPVLGGVTDIKRGLVCHGWNVEPVDGMPNDADALIDYAIRERLGWSNLSGVVMDAVDVGFSVAEKVPELLRDGEFAGSLVVGSLIPHHPSTVAFEVDDYGRVAGIGIDVPGHPRVVVPASRFLYAVYRSHYASPYGSGDYARAHRAWFVKAEAIKKWGVWSDRNALGTRVVKYPPATNPDQQSAVLDAITKQQAQYVVMVPEGWDVTLSGGGDDGSAFWNAVRDCNMEMAKAVLGVGLISEEGTRVGSKAMSSIHMDAAKAAILGAISFAEDVINRQVVRPIVRWNYGTQAKAPVVRLARPNHEQLAATLDYIGKAIDFGVVDASEPWIRERAQLPEDTRTPDEKLRSETARIVGRLARVSPEDLKSLSDDDREPTE